LRALSYTLRKREYAVMMEAPANAMCGANAYTKPASKGRLQRRSGRWCMWRGEAWWKILTWQDLSFPGLASGWESGSCVRRTLRPIGMKKTRDAENRRASHPTNMLGDGTAVT